MLTHRESGYRSISIIIITTITTTIIPAYGAQTPQPPASCRSLLWWGLKWGCPWWKWGWWGWRQQRHLVEEIKRVWHIKCDGSVSAEGVCACSSRGYLMWVVLWAYHWYIMYLRREDISDGRPRGYMRVQIKRVCHIKCDGSVPADGVCECSSRGYLMWVVLWAYHWYIMYLRREDISDGRPRGYMRVQIKRVCHIKCDGSVPADGVCECSSRGYLMWVVLWAYHWYIMYLRREDINDGRPRGYMRVQIKRVWHIKSDGSVSAEGVCEFSSRGYLMWVVLWAYHWYIMYLRRDPWRYTPAQRLGHIHRWRSIKEEGGGGGRDDVCRRVAWEGVCEGQRKVGD